jgi:hypothetical protein
MCHVLQRFPLYAVDHDLNLSLLSLWLWELLSQTGSLNGQIHWMRGQGEFSMTRAIALSMLVCLPATPP